MGHFSYNCKLSNLPITDGTKVVLITMLPQIQFDNYNKIGTTHFISNNGPNSHFSPIWYPIKGEYNGYGGIENIIKDDNTEILEKYYDLTIEEICGVITSNRKDDGYDDNLDCIKDKSKKDEYGKPQYLDKYKKLIRISGMWIHGEFYDKLVNEKTGNYFDKLDMGIPHLLVALGFKQTRKGEGRFNLVFEKDGVEVFSDGNWLDGQIYSLKSLNEKVNIDLDKHQDKDRYEQLYDYVFSNYNLTSTIPTQLKYVINNALLANNNSLFGFSLEENKTLSSVYLENAINGKLRKNIVEFFRFDSYMYATGTFYFPVGTSPQDGDIESVRKVLNIANNIINKQYEDYIEDYGDDD
jgi:hypothetical protein